MDEREILARLTACDSTLLGWFQDPEKRRKINYYDVIYNRYVGARDELVKLYPALTNDLPYRQFPKSAIFYGELLFYTYEAEFLWEDIRYCLNFLNNMREFQVPPVSLDREGVFFAGQYFDALMRLDKILSSANNNIEIIDAYIQKDVLPLLSEKAKGVTVKILARDPEPKFLVPATAFNKQYGDLSVRSTNNFHDRFVFIDGTDFYHFGMSFDIKNLGKRGFMFSRIEEPDIIQALQDKFASEWAAAKVHI